MIDIALPKGRLGEKVYAMFEKAGFPCPSIHDDNRKLIFENKENGELSKVYSREIEAILDNGTITLPEAQKALKQVDKRNEFYYRR